MIHVNLESIRCGFQIVPPAFGSFDDGQHLLLVNRIISFGRGHQMRHVCDWPEVAIVFFHRKHSTDGKFRGIGFQPELTILIRVL